MLVLLLAMAGCTPGGEAPGHGAVPEHGPAQPHPPVGVKVWAVDTTGVTKAELVFSSPEPLLLEGVSPDGRVLVSRTIFP